MEKENKIVPPSSVEIDKAREFLINALCGRPISFAVNAQMIELMSETLVKFSGTQSKEFLEWAFKENYFLYVNKNTYIHHTVRHIDYETHCLTLDELYEVYLKYLSTQTDAKA